jgi:hypothetical protein
MKGDRLAQHLLELADGLEAERWQHRLLDEMSPAQRAAYEATPLPERIAWLRWSLSEPLEVTYDDDTGETLRIAHNGNTIYQSDDLERWQTTP